MLHSHRRRDGGPSAHSKAAALLFAVLPLQSAIMARYSQFCALARAAEILGERWTLLIIRELLLRQKRFSDLSDRLSGVSPTVLTARLNALVEHGVVQRVTLPPPFNAQVYELTPIGLGLKPAIRELIRWGGH